LKKEGMALTGMLSIRPYLFYSYVEMQPQVLLVGVREALAKKTSFQYNVYWLPTANKIVKDVFYV
jgi:hypothetical protein